MTLAYNSLFDGHINLGYQSLDVWQVTVATTLEEYVIKHPITRDADGTNRCVRLRWSIEEFDIFNKQESLYGR